MRRRRLRRGDVFVRACDDPRARILGPLAGLVAERNEEIRRRYRIATEVERVVLSRLSHQKGIFPNVDFYAGLVYLALGIEIAMFTPMFADYMQAYGRGGVKAEALGALPWLSRLYWYTVEFGLIRTPAGLRNYGAGILSSPSEVEYAIASPKPRRVLFDLKRIMRSQYRIDDFQETYFVIDSFQQLFDATEPDFTPLYQELMALPDLPANAKLPDDRLV